MEKTDILIVGAGAAGMSAAIAAKKAGCTDVLVADKASSPGGILTRCAHKGFGFAALGEELTGPEYAGRISREFALSGARLRLNTAVLSISENKTAILSDRSGVYELGFEKLILASGSYERSIGTLHIAGTRPSGIFTAGQAQEQINLRHQSVGSNILILGSGDLGLIMARRFFLEGKNVIAVVEKESRYGGMTRNYRRCIEEYGIALWLDSTVAEIHGESRISAVTVKELRSGKSRLVPCDTLVTALGLIPQRELIRDVADADWLYLCGNCKNIHDIADSAWAEGEKTGRTAAL